MFKTYLIIIALLLFTATLPAQSDAAGSCQTIYNGGTVCSSQTNGTLSIGLDVQNPQTKEFTNTLRQDQYVFSQDETVNFQVKVTNTGSGSASNITITDTLPANLDFAGGDGTFDANKHTLTIKLDQLVSKASKTYTYQAVVNSKTLPNNQSVACVLNQVAVQTTSFIFFTSTQGQSTATVCLGNKPAGMPTVSTTQSNTNTQQPTPSNNTNPSSVVSIPPVKIKQTQPQTTKGGQPIYTAPTTKQSPPTGPDAATLLVLPAFAFIGKKLKNLS